MFFVSKKKRHMRRASIETEMSSKIEKKKTAPANKSQIYMKFTLIYLVFCIVYHLFWTFWCLFLSCRWCLSGKIKERAKSSKKESKEARLGKSREHAAAWGPLVKNPRLACRSMPNSCRSMPRRFKNRIFKTCRSMPNHTAAWPR